jgi:hypothetical protein
MIFPEGEFRNEKKYAELVYVLPISGNSGVQKQMALMGGGEWRIDCDGGGSCCAQDIPCKYILSFRN